jgi:3-oxoacyl-[acyl-carrier protein] reductase
MNDVKGKIAIVTGASKGIGAAIAKRLALGGASVAVNYATSRDGADKVVAEIRAAGGHAIAIQGDVSRASEAARLFEETRVAFGAPNILVNSAGVFKFQALTEVTEDDFHWHYNVNVLGVINTAQQALKYFPPEGGSIVNIGSVVSTNPRPGAVIYASTKAAVDAITVTLSRELGHRNIRVNTVAPGHTETEGVARLGLKGGDVSAAFAKETPLGSRVADADDIAPAVAFLASDDAAWLTGERISASGGWR